MLAALERDEQPIEASLTAVLLREMDPLGLAEVWAKDASAELIERWMRYVARILRNRRTGSNDDLLTRTLTGTSDRQLLEHWDRLSRERLLLRGTTNPNVRLLCESQLLAWSDLTSHA